MTKKSFFESLGLPEATRLDQRVFKKFFTDHLTLSATEKRTLSEAVEEIIWRYVLKPDTINIPAFKDSEREYDEIAVIEVALTTPTKAATIQEIVHKIPYPIVLILSHAGSIYLSLAPKRLNKADASKLTIEEHIDSGWIDLTAPAPHESASLAQFTLERFDPRDLYHLYESMGATLTALTSAKHTGRYNKATDTNKTKETIKAIEELEKQALKVGSQLKKATQFNEKVALNMELKAIKKKMMELKEELS